MKKSDLGSGINILDTLPTLLVLSIENAWKVKGAIKTNRTRLTLNLPACIVLVVVKRNAP